MNSLQMLARYKAWADEIAFESVMSIPLEEALKPRSTTFGSIAGTLGHALVVDDIFRHHLEGRPHRYQQRKLDNIPPLHELRDAVREMDRWYVERANEWSAEELAIVVEFEFIGGGQGAMTREEILLHIVNHSTYHRGFVGDMLKQIPFHWAANDLTVFLRDHQIAR